MVWEKIQEYFIDVDEQMNFLFARREYNGISLDGNLEAAASNHHFEIFPFIWDLMNKNCENFKDKVLNENFANFFTLICKFSNASTFGPVVEKLKPIFNDEEFKELLLKDTFEDINLLAITLRNTNINGTKAVWEMIENHFGVEEIISKFNLDKVLFRSIYRSPTKEIFDLYCEKIKNILGDEKYEKTFQDILKKKSASNQNLLHKIAMKKIKVPEIINFIFEKIESTLGVDYLKSMLTEEDEEDLWPIHYSIGSLNEGVFRQIHVKLLPDIEVDARLQNNYLNSMILMILSQINIEEIEPGSTVRINVNGFPPRKIIQINSGEFEPYLTIKINYSEEA
jgi:hypothetical protein